MMDERARLLSQLETAERLCTDPLFTRFQGVLRDRIEKLRSLTFTVALFGAFSAGKSSLINALLGGQVLPVSPNPTTAAINRILPPDADHPHQTVRVIMKDEATVFKEVQEAASMLGVPISSLSDIEVAIMKHRPSDLPAQAKPYYSFLRAIAAGLRESMPQLGQTLSVPFGDFKAFVAREQHAAFIERIDLYYHSSLSETGAILVDTPGADSIHMRHTDVAFRYLRDADAVLFVTYYNHAFSEADRDFLLQLAKVKEVRTQEAMFFVINAKDIGKNDDERNQVKSYVEDQFQRLGIRQPNIFMVSSQIGMIAKLPVSQVTGAVEKLLRERLHVQVDESVPTSQELLDISGVSDFESAILAFTRDRLQHIAVEAGIRDLKEIRSAIEKAVKNLVIDKEASEAQVARQESILRDIAAHAQSPLTAERQSLVEEIRELFYHVAQRISFAHHDMIVRGFHPSTITGAGAASSGLSEATIQWLAILSTQIGQELRATSILVQHHSIRLILERYGRIRLTFGASELSIAWPDGSPQGASYVPAMPELRDDADIDRIVKRHFKNSAHFFEQGGRRELAQALEPVAQTLVKNACDRLEIEFVDVYGKWLEDEAQRMCDQVELLCEQFRQAQRAALADETAVNRLQSALRQWPGSSI